MSFEVPGGEDKRLMGLHWDMYSQKPRWAFVDRGFIFLISDHALLHR